VIRPQGLWRGRLGWGVVHYGLVFARASAAYVVRSAHGANLKGLPARRADIGRWRLVDLDGCSVLLLSRRWLITRGRLTSLAALMPWLRFRLEPRLLDDFWLEAQAPLHRLPLRLTGDYARPDGSIEPEYSSIPR